MKELKDKINFLRKMKKCISGRNPKASYLMTETLIVQKVAYILASLCEVEWFSSILSSEQNELQIGKKLTQKNSRAKKFRCDF